MEQLRTFRTSLRWLSPGRVAAVALLAWMLVLVPASVSGQEAGQSATTNPVKVTYLAPPDAGVTFAKDVAPLIQENCEGCHRPGSVAPMVLQNYEQVKMFAPLIRDRVSRRLMPPWPIDKTIGVKRFRNDISLSDEEIKTIVDWVDAGAPLGDPADLPEPRVWNDDLRRWPYEDVFGRPPDVVLTSPMHTVVANGRDQWPLKITQLEDVVESGELTEERWIMAIGARPADYDSRYVFHHANVSLSMPGEAPNILDEGSTALIDTAVGTDGTIFPANTGRVIRPGSEVRWNMHYHPYSENKDAALQVALWLYPKGQEPDFYTMGDVSLDAAIASSTGGTFPAGDFKGASDPQLSGERDILLPPNSVATMRGYHVLDRPAMVNGLRGHMHLRGKYQLVEAIYPDGRWEVINKLNWDHAWHTLFLYEEDAEPLLPTGTVILLTSVFDNTTENPHNPDPDQWVAQGDRSIDEMSHIRLQLTYFTEEEFQKRIEERAAKAKPIASRDQ